MNLAGEATAQGVTRSASIRIGRNFEGANMNCISRFTRTGAIAAIGALCFAASAPAQVLQQIPSDALVVVKLKNLQAINDKAAALSKQFGLVEMTPDAGDPLGALLGKANLGAGIDKGGDAAIAVLNGDLNAAEPSAIALIPVSDYAAFVGSFGDPKKDGDFDVIHFSFAGNKDNDDTFVAHWGNYAVLSDKKENLSKKPDGFKASGATAKELDSKDAVAVVNFKVLGPKLKELLTAKKGEMLAQLDKAVLGDEKTAKYSALIKSVVNQALWLGEEFLGDARFASFSLNLSEKGFGTSLMADFEAGSYLGKAFGGVKNSSGSLLAGLPEAKYLMFGGGVSGGDSGKKVMEDFLAPIEAELAKSGDEMKPIISFVDAMKKVVAAQKAQVFGVIQPSGALGASALIQTVAITTGDAKAILDGQAKALEAEQKLMELMPSPGGVKRPMMKFEVTPNVKTVDGVQFNQFTSGIDPNDNSPEAMQVKMMLTYMYGPSGAGGYMGAIDDQHVLVVSGVDDAMIGAAIKASKEKQDNLSKNEGVMLVAQQLPKQRVGEFYVAVDEIVNTASNYAKMMGIPIPISMKPNLPPIGIAVATDGPAIRIDSFIPADLVEAVVTTSLQLRMLGGGRGKPGGL